MTTLLKVGDSVVLVDESDVDSIKAAGELKVVEANGNFSVRFCHLTAYLPLSHFLLGRPPSGYEIDHVDRNPLNNTRSNLRLITKAENRQNRGLFKNNTRGFKGVKVNGNGHIYAQCKVNGIAYFKYGCKTLRDAALAYDELVHLHGSKAPTNKSLGLL